MNEMSEAKHYNYSNSDAESNTGRLSNLKISWCQAKVKGCLWEGQGLHNVKVRKSHSESIVSEVDLISLKLNSTLNNDISIFF